jgi:hypothetical protein
MFRSSLVSVSCLHAHQPPSTSCRSRPARQAVPPLLIGLLTVAGCLGSESPTGLESTATSALDWESINRCSQGKRSDLSL